MRGARIPAAGDAARLRVVLLAALAALGAAGAARAQSTTPASEEGTFLIAGATVVTGTGDRLEGASILIRDGRVEALGPDVRAPADAVRIDGAGRYVYPGFIDSATGLGLSEISSVGATRDNVELGEYTPYLRALRAVNPHSNLIPAARVNGIVAAVTVPGGGTVPGQAALLRLDGWTWEEMGVRAPAALVIQHPRLSRFRGAPTPAQLEAERRRKAARVRELRDFLERSRSYARQRPPGSAPADLALEAMRPVMAGEVPVLFYADEREDILSAVEIAGEFGLRMILAGGREAWRVADVLAARGIPVVLGSLLSSAPPDGPYDALFAQPAILHEAGVKFAFSTGSTSDVRNLPYHAAMAVAYGLDEEAALRALTIWPAEIWGVADRFGTIEVGKPANLFVATGDPLDVRTRVEEVFIDGRRTSMDDRHTRLYRKFSQRPRP